MGRRIISLRVVSSSTEPFSGSARAYIFVLLRAHHAVSNHFGGERFGFDIAIKMVFEWKDPAHSSAGWSVPGRSWAGNIQDAT